MNASQSSSRPLPDDGGGGGGGVGQQQHQQQGSSDGNTGNNGTFGEGGSHKERRASIQAIMRDPALTPQQRRRSIQSIMDGRRRSSSCMIVSDCSAPTPLGLGGSATRFSSSPVNGNATITSTSGLSMHDAA